MSRARRTPDQSAMKSPSSPPSHAAMPLFTRSSARRPIGRATLLSLGLGLAALFGTTGAGAAGALVGPSELAPADAKALEALVAQARGTEAASFAARDALRAELPRLDAQKRGPYAPLSRPLKDLGPRSVPALLEAIALDAGLGRQAPVPASPPAGLSESAWLAWRVGLLEAVGSHRDPASAPVLRAVLERPSLEAPVLRAAAAAYGKLGTSDAVRLLGQLAQGGDARAEAALYGLGHARTPRSAELLAAELRKLPSGGRASTIVHALGDVGSAWAWRAIERKPRGADPKQADATRLAATEALVRAFVPYGGHIRKDIEKALLVVDDPRAKGLLEREKRGADAATAQAIDSLLARLAKGPRGR